MIRPPALAQAAGVALYDASEIAAMRAAGRLAALTLTHLKPHIRPGVATGELNALAETFIRSYGAEPTFLNYGADSAGTAFPAAICASLNDEAVHGIPTPHRRLHRGDLLSLSFFPNVN